MKHTEWFSAEVKPEQDGVYQRQVKEGKVLWSRWFGGVWRALEPYEHWARTSQTVSLFQDLPWRGILK